MQLVYSGAHPEVTVDELNDLRGEDVVILNGKPVDVPDDLAARLLEQNTWTRATAETPEDKAAREKREQDEAVAAKAEAEAQAKLAADNATKGNN